MSFKISRFGSSCYSYRKWLALYTGGPCLGEFNDSVLFSSIYNRRSWLYLSSSMLDA